MAVTVLLVFRAERACPTWAPVSAMAMPVTLLPDAVRVAMSLTSAPVTVKPVTLESACNVVAWTTVAPITVRLVTREVFSTALILAQATPLTV